MGSRSAKDIWEAALGELQIQVSKQNFRTWLSKTEGLSLEDKKFVVGVPNTFVAEYLDKKQRSLIEKTLIGLTAGDVQVAFRVTNGASGPHGNGHAPDGGERAQTNYKMLNPRYTFASFVVGSCNQLACGAAQGILENPGKEYNPLFIYGGVGLGKTHLMHAIGQAAQARDMKVLYVSAENFTNEFVAALSERNAGDFRKKFRGVDMLLIDDVQFLGGKERTEESFFHTFNELHNSGRQIVISSDLPPREMPTLQNRLRSRFEGGLMVTVLPPDPDTRVGILKAKAEQQGAAIPEDSLQLIAEQAEHSVRELEGLLNRVIAYTKLVGAPATPELVARATADIAAPVNPDATTSPQRVIEAVARGFGLSPADLRGKKRVKEIARARHVAMYLARQETKCSLADIGGVFGGRDHSTVIHACEKTAADMNDNPLLQRKILEIQRALRSGSDDRK